MPNYTNYPVASNLTLTQIKDRIKKSIETFFKLDSYLITNDLHEISITHRLAIYLDEIFINYNVDCEWNKNLNKPKTIYFEEPSLKSFLEEINRQVPLRIEKIKKEIRDAKNKQLYFINYLEKDFIEKKERSISQLQKIQKFINHEWNQDDVEYTDSSGSKYYKLSLKNDTGENVLKKIRPDIIIHHRGTKQNFAVLEVKKKNAGGKNYYEKSKHDDLLKLLAMTMQQNLKYKYGFFIELPEKDFIWKKIQISSSEYLKGFFDGFEENIFVVKFI